MEDTRARDSKGNQRLKQREKGRERESEDEAQFPRDVKVCCRWRITMAPIGSFISLSSKRIPGALFWKFSRLRDETDDSTTTTSLLCGCDLLRHRPLRVLIKSFPLGDREAGGRGRIQSSCLFSLSARRLVISSDLRRLHRHSREKAHRRVMARPRVLSCSFLARESASDFISCAIQPFVSALSLAEILSAAAPPPPPRNTPKKREGDGEKA